MSPFFLKKLKDYDLVVLHSFSLYWSFLVLFAPRGVKFAWLGWGYDYYNYIYDNLDDLLLKKTLKIQGNYKYLGVGKLNPKKNVKYFVKFLIDKLIIPLVLAIPPQK